MPHRGTCLTLSLIGMCLAGCDTEPAACTEEVRPGVVVEIRDAFDDTPLANEARGVVQDGSFIDSLRPYGSVENGTLVSRAAAAERPGTYEVTVQREGYLPWVGGAVVRHDACHVETVVLSVYLHRPAGE
jgi:hypothetical protein